MRALTRGINVVAVILQQDDGVLINNRLQRTLPIVDEVTLIDRTRRRAGGGRSGGDRAGDFAVV